MKYKKLIVLALIAGLAVGSLTAADAKKKKKKKKKKPVPVQVDQTYFLRADSNETVADANLRLSIEDGADPGNGYGWAEYGVWNEVFNAAGQSDLVLTDVWPAIDGLPLKLDASKNLTGTINLTSWNPGSAGGQTLTPPGRPTVDITFVGDINGEAVTLGSSSQTYDLSPAQAVYEVPVDIDLADDVDKQVLTSLQMSVWIHGASNQHGSYELDDPASSVVVPTWQVKKKK